LPTRLFAAEGGYGTIICDQNFTGKSQYHQSNKKRLKASAAIYFLLEHIATNPPIRKCEDVALWIASKVG